MACGVSALLVGTTPLVSLFSAFSIMALYAGLSVHLSNHFKMPSYPVRGKGLNKRITETEFNRRMEIEAKMAEDKRLDEERKQAEAERTVKKKADTDEKKFITQGAVKKPVIKRRGRGF